MINELVPKSHVKSIKLIALFDIPNNHLIFIFVFSIKLTNCWKQDKISRFIESNTTAPIVITQMSVAEWTTWVPQKLQQEKNRQASHSAQVSTFNFSCLCLMTIMMTSAKVAQQSHLSWGPSCSNCFEELLRFSWYNHFIYRLWVYSCASNNKLSKWRPTDLRIWPKHVAKVI